MRQMLSARGGAYALTVILCGLALCVKLMVGPVVLPGPFSTFLPAVLLAAWAGGIGPGLLATAICTVLAVEFVMPATLMSGASGWTGFLQVATFVGAGSAMSTLVGALRSSRDRLSVTEQRFRTLVESVADYAVFLVDAHGRCVTWNAGGEHLFGFREADIVGKAFARLWSATAAPDRSADGLLAEAARIGQATREIELPRADGSRLWTHVLVTTVRDHRGRPRGYAVIMRDVTERRLTLAALQAAHDDIESRIAVRTGDLSRVNHLLREEVAERRAIEAALRESEEKYRDLVENINDVLFAIDRAGVFTYISPALLRLTGHDPQEVTGRHFSEFVLPRYVPALAAEMQEMAAGGAPVPAEFEVRKRSGGSLWVTSLSRPILVDGAVVGFRGRMSDISDRKQAEEALRQRTAELEAIFNAVPDLWFRMDREGRFLDYRVGEVTRLYAQPDTFLGKLVEDILPEPAASVYGGLVRQVARSREPASAEYPLVMPDGRHFYEARAWPFLDGDVIAIVRDVTERTLAAQALRESEEKFRSLAESTAATIFIQCGDRLAYVNPAAETLTGYPTEELLRMDFWNLIDPRFREQAMVRSALRFRGGNVPQRAIVKIVRRDGEARWVDFTLKRIEYPRGPAMLGAAIDITERKAAEREARQRQAELAHVLRVSTMGEMAASLAHELNQPLQAVVNFATGCLRRLERANGAAAELHDPLSQIAAEALRAGEIVRRIRRFVRKAPARRELVDVNELVLEATRIFEPEGASDGVIIDVGVEPDLPPVEVDSIQIQQVILNLLRNGMEAMSSTPAGTRVLRVETCLDEAGIRVRVRDAGRGFAPELSDLLFEPFYTTKPQGLGMGLSISRSIIEAHGGHLFGFPRPEGGAEFGFVLSARSQGGATYAA